MKFFNKQTNETVTPQFLDGIMRGLNYVANCASDMSFTHYKNMVEEFFDKEEDGSYTPKIKKAK